MRSRPQLGGLCWIPRRLFAEKRRCRMPTAAIVLSLDRGSSSSTTPMSLSVVLPLLSLPLVWWRLPSSRVRNESGSMRTTSSPRRRISSKKASEHRTVYPWSACRYTKRRRGSFGCCSFDGDKCKPRAAKCLSTSTSLCSSTMY